MIPAAFLPDPLPREPLSLAADWLAEATRRAEQPNRTPWCSQPSATAGHLGPRGVVRKSSRRPYCCLHELPVPGQGTDPPRAGSDAPTTCTGGVHRGQVVSIPAARAMYFLAPGGSGSAHGSAQSEPVASRSCSAPWPSGRRFHAPVPAGRRPEPAGARDPAAAALGRTTCGRARSSWDEANRASMTSAMERVEPAGTAFDAGFGARHAAALTAAGVWRFLRITLLLLCCSSSPRRRGADRRGSRDGGSRCGWASIRCEATMIP